MIAIRHLAMGCLMVLISVPAAAQKLPAGFFVDNENSIRCGVFQSGLSCEIDYTDWMPTDPEPKDCEFDRIKFIAMDAKGRPESGWICVSDSWMHEGIKSLPIGAKWQSNAYSCVRNDKRLRCVNLAGHGWNITARSVKIF